MFNSSNRSMGNGNRNSMDNDIRNSRIRRNMGIHIRRSRNCSIYVKVHQIDKGFFHPTGAKDFFFLLHCKKILQF